MKLSENFLPLIADASLRGGIIILLLIALRPWLRRFFGSAWVSLLWLVVLARLLMFWPVESPWSAFNLWPKTQPQTSSASPWKISVSISGDAAEKSQPVQSATTNLALLGERQRNRLAVTGAVWALGALGMFAYFCVRGWRTARIARRTETANDPRLQKVFASIQDKVRKKATLYVTDEVSVPALVGIWYPQIWMPREWLTALSDDELRHVLLHELGHACRADLAVQWLFALAQCVHWFNPLVWLAERFERADAEMACDAWVLARSAEPERERYGGTLLKTSQLFRKRLSITPIAIGMAASRSALVARVHHVGKYRPVSRWRAWLGLSVAALAAVALMTNQTSAQAPATQPAKPVEKTNSPPDEPNPSAAPVPSASPTEQKPTQQIEIEAKFFEVTEPVAKKLGLVQTNRNADSTATDEAKNSQKNEPLAVIKSILNQDAVDQVLKKLNDTKDVDLLSTPRVTTKSGERATINLIREFRYPTEYQVDKTSGKTFATAFETRNLGVTLAAEPVAKANNIIDLVLCPEVVELEGFVTATGGQPVPLRKGGSVGANSPFEDFESVPTPKDTVLLPVFSERKVTTSVTLHSGQSVLIGGLKREEKHEGEPSVSRILYILITARIVDASGTASLPPATTVPASSPPFKVTILGEVNKPGVYTVDADSPLASIIAEAQGFTKVANQKKVTVTAKDGSKTIVDFKANPVSYTLNPGDVVSVEERMVNF